MRSVIGGSIGSAETRDDNSVVGERRASGVRNDPKDEAKGVVGTGGRDAQLPRSKTAEIGLVLCTTVLWPFSPGSVGVSRGKEYESDVELAQRLTPQRNHDSLPGAREPNGSTRKKNKTRKPMPASL